MQSFRPCWPQRGCFDPTAPPCHGGKFSSLVSGSLPVPVDVRVQLCHGSEVLQVICVIASFSCLKQLPLGPPVQQCCRSPRATAAPTAFQEGVTNPSHGSASFRIKWCHGIITLFRQGLERGPSAGVLNELTNAHGMVFQNEVGKFSAG